MNALSAAGVLMLVLLMLGSPLTTPASADGPTSPLATSYIGRVTTLPAGMEAKVVDGYLQLWLRVPSDETAVVLDYRGAPWVRFDRAGVAINENSEMYYLSQTPVPAIPPAGLRRTTPPNWQMVSSGHSYMWRDGRLHALAAIALAPGTRYVGHWAVPIVVDGRDSVIAGGLWYAPNPSTVWFWPIAVIIACVLAAWRVHNPALDRRIARGLAFAVLAGMLVAAVGRGLHGRPSVSALQLGVFVVSLAVLGYLSSRVIRHRVGYPTLFLIAFAGLWVGAMLVPTALHHYVLMAVPAVLARSAMVVCLGGAIGLILLALRMLSVTYSGRTAPANEQRDEPRSPARGQPIAG